MTVTLEEIASSPAEVFEYDTVPDWDDAGYFTKAYCYELALELHECTSWDLYVCLQPGLNWLAVHALIRRPDGLYLDISGTSTRERLSEAWPKTVLRRVSAAYFDSWDSFYGPVDRDRVRSAAKKLLDRPYHP